ncbi:hypothetical protein [Bacillus safensis]|nr:hypothetical protein [Bacillus safensis]MED4992095.1 hypothetical protein [Bacillus safensis]
MEKFVTTFDIETIKTFVAEKFEGTITFMLGKKGKIEVRKS